MNPMLTWSLQWQLDLEANCQGLEGEIKDNHENGKVHELHIKIYLMLKR